MEKCNSKNTDLNSSKDKECRYCLASDKISNLIHPCKCYGSLKYVHSECLSNWIVVKKEEEIFDQNYTCEICKYTIKYSKKYKNNFWKTLLILLNKAFTLQKYCYTTFCHFFLAIFLFKRIKLLISDFLSYNRLKSKWNLIHNILIFLSVSMIIYDGCIYYKNNFQIARGVKYQFENIDEN
jgi:E3 ubiquitin-protein ligase DOA10